MAFEGLKKKVEHVVDQVKLKIAMTAAKGLSEESELKLRGIKVKTFALSLNSNNLEKVGVQQVEKKDNSLVTIDEYTETVSYFEDIELTVPINGKQIDIKHKIPDTPKQFVGEEIPSRMIDFESFPQVDRYRIQNEDAKVVLTPYQKSLGGKGVCRIVRVDNGERIAHPSEFRQIKTYTGG